MHSLAQCGILGTVVACPLRAVRYAIPDQPHVSPGWAVVVPESEGTVAAVPVHVAEYLVAVRIVGAGEADNQKEEWSWCFAVVRGD